MRDPGNGLLYGNTTDLYKMVETNIVLSIKSTKPVFTCILCHLPALQADSKRFRGVSVNGTENSRNFQKCPGNGQQVVHIFDSVPQI